MLYKPKAVRKGIKLPFGYYVNPLDPYVALPDKEKLDALHYSFQMRVKYRTSLRNCTMWLHGATGQRMTPHGYLFAYNSWLKRLKKERRAEIDSRKKALIKVQQNYIDENFKALCVTIDQAADISSVAQSQAKEELQKKR